MSTYSSLIKKLASLSGKEAEEMALKMSKNLSPEKRIDLARQIKAAREADQIGEAVVTPEVMAQVPAKSGPEIIKKKSPADLNKTFDPELGDDVGNRLEAPSLDRQIESVRKKNPGMTREDAINLIQPDKSGNVKPNLSDRMIGKGELQIEEDLAKSKNEILSGVKDTEYPLGMTVSSNLDKSALARKASKYKEPGKGDLNTSLAKTAQAPDEIIPPSPGLVKSERRVMDAEITENAKPRPPKRSIINPKTVGTAAAIGGTGVGLLSTLGGNEPKKPGLAGGESEAQIIQKASSPKASSEDVKAGVQKVQENLQNATKPMGSADSGTSTSPSSPTQGETKQLKDYKAMSFEKTLKQLESLKKTVPDKVSSEFDKKYKELEARYNADKNKIANAEMWEALINAAGGLAAGIYGLKTGLNMSGLKFDKANWDAKLDRAYREYDALRDLVTKEKDRAESRLDRDKSFNEEVELKRIGLGKEEEESVTDLANKKIADENRMIQQAAEDARRAQREASSQAFRAGESAKDRQARLDAAKIQAEASKERAKISASGRSQPSSLGRPTQEEKPVVDRSVQQKLNQIQKTISQLTKPGFKEQARLTLKGLGYTKEQIEQLESKGGILPGKPSVKEVLSGELAKAQSELNQKLYTTPSQIKSRASGGVQPSGMVKILDPLDNKVKSIPEEALEEALQDGAKLIE
jgi:hypothetical protein